MNELKVYHCNEWHNEYTEFYLKSEADKVIAGKDAEIASLKREIANIQDKMCEDVFEGIMPSEHIVCLPLQQAAEYIAELKAQKAQTEDDCAYWKAKAQRGRHANYKRCVAMWLYLRGCYWRCKYHNEQTRADWYNKWMNVYQKLAEKFKEAK